MRFCTFIVFVFVSLTDSIAPLHAGFSAQTCTYTDWVWNSELGRAEGIRQIVKQRSSVTAEERHASLPCSICREDQQEIFLPGIQSFSVCKAVADDIEAALMRAVVDGFMIEEITGYRVGRTKGALNNKGQRTAYSNHSFGLAIDINPNANGLYDRCNEWSSSCRLIRGGRWRPGKPGAISYETRVYKELSVIGWRWGGDLQGQQKDFMHFSPSGD